MRSGAPNEVWSYGEDVYKICEKYLKIRESMRDYTRSLMKDAHERGSPVMRPCFYDFPEDSVCWEVEDQFMYGHKYLCAPIFEAGLKMRKLHLPPGTWMPLDGGKELQGPGDVEVECPIAMMPVFVRQG
jgi:alpha-D-xyloside xylohydrolase